MSDTIKLAIAIPTAGMVRAGFAYSLAGAIGRLTQGISTRPESGIEIAVDMQESTVIHSNRELLAKRALTSGKTHILFIDDDMSFEPQVLDIMLGRRQPVVAVNYLIKKFPPEFVAVAENGRRIITDDKSAGLQEIAYTGFGVSLFETQVFAKTPQPWFQPEFVPEADSYTTEDNPFYRRVREAGFKCYIDHDASKLVTHIGGTVSWTYKQYVRPSPPDLKIVKEAV